MVDELLQQSPNIKVATREGWSVPPSDVPQVNFYLPPQSITAFSKSNRLATNIPGPEDSIRRTDRTPSHTRALEESEDSHACLSLKSPKGKPTFDLDRTVHITSILFRYLIFPARIMTYSASEVSEVEAEQMLPSSTRNSKYRDIWEQSMQE